MHDKQYRIPDLLQNWPWKRCLSPHYNDVKAESSVWIESFKPFSERGQKAFNACDISLLGSLTYSNRNFEFVRLGCDLMNFYFTYDEYADVSDAATAETFAEQLVDAMKRPRSRTKPANILVGMIYEFLQHLETIAGPESLCHKHFLQEFETYFLAVAQEVNDRTSQRIRSLGDYMDLCRDTSGTRPTIALTEFGLDLPEFVTSHPKIVSLKQSTVNLIILTNDMHSYVREVSCGHAHHNVITVIMHERNIDLQEALDWLKVYNDEIVSEFLSDLQSIPSWGADIDSRVKTYIDGLGQWVRGNDDWSYECKRYHGDDGINIKESRLIIIKLGQRNYLSSEPDGMVP